VNEAATTRKSNTFHPLRKKSCGREPADAQLDDEDAEEHVVERAQQAARIAHDAVVGLQTEHDGIGHDDDEDEDVERRGVRDLRTEADERGAAVLVLALVGGGPSPHRGASLVGNTAAAGHPAAAAPEEEV
jgi:hypothetical protein